MQITRTRVKTTLQIGRFDISVSRCFRRELAYRGNSLNFFGLFVVGYDRSIKQTVKKAHGLSKAIDYGTFGPIHLRKLITGHLQISVSEDGRQELIMMVAQHNDENERRAKYLQSGKENKFYLQPTHLRSWDSLQYDVLDTALCNGFSLIDPEQVGALTSATLFGQIDIDDHGVIEHIENVWWDSQYMVQDWIEELIQKGEVIWDSGISDGHSGD